MNENRFKSVRTLISNDDEDFLPMALHTTMKKGPGIVISKSKAGSRVKNVLNQDAESIDRVSTSPSSDSSGPCDFVARRKLRLAVTSPSSSVHKMKISAE
jgi:hypothetical protein